MPPAPDKPFFLYYVPVEATRRTAEGEWWKKSKANRYGLDALREQIFG